MRAVDYAYNIHTGHAYLNCILNFRLCDSYLYYLKINKIP